MEENTINEESENKSPQQKDDSQTENTIHEQKNIEVIQSKKKKINTIHFSLTTKLISL